MCGFIWWLTAAHMLMGLAQNSLLALGQGGALSLVEVNLAVLIISVADTFVKGILACLAQQQSAAAGAGIALTNAQIVAALTPRSAALNPVVVESTAAH